MLSCTQCSLPYQQGDVDLTLGIVHCQGCDTVSELSTTPRRADLPVVPKPAMSKWWVDDDAEGLYLSRSWRGAQVAFLLFFSVIWDGALLVMFLGIAASDGILTALPMLAMPHVWVGVALGYYVVASLVNTTEIVIEDGELGVAHGPLPWWGNRSLQVPDIAQIYVEVSGVRVNKQPRWNLCAMTADGSGQVLVRMLTSEAEGRWLEDCLERALMITDQPVAGEVHK